VTITLSTAARDRFSASRLHRLRLGAVQITGVGLEMNRGLQGSIGSHCAAERSCT